MASIFVLLVSVCLYIVFIDVKINAQYLESPCPRLFLYDPQEREKDRWYGTLTLISQDDLSGVWLRIILDKPSLQLGNWFGEVVTTDNKEYLVKNRAYKLLANTPFSLRIFVKYDTSQPPPQLVGFRLNAKTVCPEGQTTTAPPPNLGLLFTSSQSGTTPAAPQQPLPQPNNDFTPTLGPPVFGSNPAFIPPSNNDIECGTIAVQARPLITYGQKTEAGEFPWHAALYLSRGVSLNYICGGSLISKLHVITVAHCVSRPRSQTTLNPVNLLVYLGKYYLRKWSNPGVQDHQVSKIIVHPQYDPRLYSNDIAVLKLAREAEFNDYVRPVCLWQDFGNINQFVGVQGTVVGWGFDENGKLTEELTMLKMPIVSKEICIYSFPDFFSRFTTNETFCAGYRNGTSVCNGDSGGGMVFPKRTRIPNRKAYQLRGLVSVSVALQNEYKCDASHYVVFTDVAKYLNFIKAAMAK